MKDQIQEKLNQISDLIIRINLETDLAAWCSVNGHVNTINLSISETKDRFQDKLHKAELRYQPFLWDFQSKEAQEEMIKKWFEEFKNDADQIIKDLSDTLAKNWEEIHIVSVSLKETSFSQPFLSIEEAQKYEKKMKRKYGKVTGAFISINTESREK